MERKDIPQNLKWNLADLFPSDEAWEEEYKAIEKEIKRDIENDSKLKNRGIEVFRLPSTNGLNTRYAKTLSRHWSALNSFLIKAPNGGIKGFGAPYCCPACERFSQTEKCQYCGSLCNIVMY